MLTKSTHDYANHEIALKCDIYEADSYPSSNPVFLFFHSGGLVGGGRECVPPWVVQACMQRKWTLISASYRFLPQSGDSGLVQDALAAYKFAQSWKADGVGQNRQVIIGGASAGLFMANLVAHHITDTAAPKAILGISGLPTFRHPFFNSSVLLTQKPHTDQEVEPFITGPLSAGDIPEGEDPFSMDCLLPSGLKNPRYATLPKSTAADKSGVLPRWSLYDYYIYKNTYLDMIGDIDPGFEWAKEEPPNGRLQKWPPTVFIQGDADTDVPMDVVTHVVDCLGPKKATLCVAKSQNHLFEATSYLEDEGETMDVVRQALAYVDKLC